MTIEELKQVLEAATPGPWAYNFEEGDDYTTIRAGEFEVADTWFCPEMPANAYLIVEAVNNLPKLLKVVEERDALQARCDELESAALSVLAHLTAAVSVIKTSEESGNHPSCAYGSDTMYRMAMKDFDRCMEAGRKALSSVVDGGE